MPDTVANTSVDFDLHGFVGVRLLDATPADIAAVRRQLGPLESPLTREPEIVCRFVDRLRVHGRLHYIGLDEAAFTDDAYLILRSKHKARARVQIPMAAIGSRCEIICERGVPAVPLLIAIINLTALAQGYAPLHASAFAFEGIGVLVAGWAKGGKTEALLGFMANGATYIGDEWVYLSPDGSAMYGVPEPMKVWASHLSAMPRYRSAVSRTERLRLQALAAGARLVSTSTGVVSNGTLGRVLRRAQPVIDRQAYVHLRPDDLFGRERCVLRGPLDVVVLAVSADHPRVEVQPADADEIARRMTFSVQHERLDLIGHYQRFRFAFPEGSNPNLDEAEGRQRTLLAAALNGKRALTLSHPYPAPIPEMYETLRPCLQ